MSDLVVGYIMGMAVGIAAGFAIGFAASKQQKPWSELTEQEKKLRKLLIGAGVALLVLGAMVFALLAFGL
jgi:Mg/Co/Ni transporter MgtE